MLQKNATLSRFKFRLMAAVDMAYVKISTSNEGKIKIIDGTPETYKTAGDEKAKLIFRRDNE